MLGQQNNANQANQAQGGKVLVSAVAFAAKYRSKRECYNFLAVDMGVYLPAYGKWLPIVQVSTHAYSSFLS